MNIIMLLSVIWCIFFTIIPSCCSQASSTNMSTSTSTRMRCSHMEREALLKFKHSLTDPSNRLRSWAGEDCCNWSGIRCDNRTGHVIRLDIRNPHPFNETRYDENDGNDPAYTKSCLVGQVVNPSLIDLKHLKYLDLSFNNFSGIPIPDFFGSFSELRYLNLSSSFFGGVVPHHLGNLSYMRFLDLSLFVSIPPNYMPSLRVNNLQWVSGLSYLEHLDMSFVNLSQAFNPVQAISSIPHLLELYLIDCEISENLELSISNLNLNLTSLVVLNLAVNDFHGPLPNFIQNMTSLQDLVFDENKFNGTIHNDFSHLCELESLFLSSNELSGEVHKLFENSSSCLKNSKLEDLDLSENQLNGCAPDWLGQLKNLRSLLLGYNSFVGPLPPSLWKLSSLTLLRLQHNKFNGSIPKSLGQLSHLRKLVLYSNFFEGVLSDTHFATLSNLTYLRLCNNSFTGMIPHSLCEMKSLNMLDLSRNNLSGGFPQCLSNMQQLKVLDLSSNNISGTISNFCEINHLFGAPPKCLSNLQQLKVLDLSSNNISGVIPSFISKFVQLKSLHLNRNKLHGQIPSSLMNCKSLIILDLGENNISGSVPTWIGEYLSSLKILSLRQNKMNGIIPLQLCRLTSLQVLDIAHNNISGTIPRCFSNFSGMISDVGDWDSAFGLHRDKIKVIVKGMESEYSKTLSLITCLDLSNNNLVGEIHEELMTLFALRWFNLSKNKLEGTIPERIGQMMLLESLDLSENLLSGRIPQSMSALTFLSHLNLSYNKLSGTIPSGHQLQTLDDPSIYSGNPGLCGAPLKMCPEAHVGGGVNSQRTKSGTLEINWFYVGMACGHAVGFWGVCGVLFFNRPWRVAYFQFLNGMKDWLLTMVAVNIAQCKRRLERNQIDG